MPGYPGTPRLGTYGKFHDGGPDKAGRNTLSLQSEDSTFEEQHRLLNPAQGSRDVGGKPGKGYVEEGRNYEAVCNHDGFEGGDAHLANLDEFKVLENYIYSTKVKFAGSDEACSPYSTDEATA